ncbi:FeS-binding protein [Kitasatospora sp. MMS16-BH015]|uniref:Rieske (2Fe-2S) protein n=1 Tax=Kitasatospora sp. MMS16-BH015 TaxID=2018025 RepID=UPI000CA2F795|nr:Rieske (2Fe-2S) protein [Kitasatospora sp. MMS16-BH015]AUG80132.1 FeS-binding protein [Kitasatospora sp. MMS16-BH015]
MTESSGMASRRTVLCGAAAAVVAGGAVAGCTSPSYGGSSSSASSSGGGSKTPAAPVQVGAVADVPVGGGKVYRDQAIVVTQPSAGQYKAFSARCTHAGCIVDQVKNGQIQCPCHGSRFGASDGAVQDGPAPEPLPSYPVVVKDGQLVVTPTA